MLLIAAAALAASTASDAGGDKRVIDPASSGNYCPDLPAGRTFIFDKPLVQAVPRSRLPAGRTFTFDKSLVRSIPLSTLPVGRIFVQRRADPCSVVDPAGVQGG
jgi:hypothetical protein